MLRSFLSRAARARVLAERRPEAREALRFYAEIAAFQHEVDPGAPLASLSPLVALVFALGPDPLRAAAREIDEERCRTKAFEISRRLFGEDHLVTQIAADTARFFPNLVYPDAAWQPPELDLEFVEGFDRGSASYIA